MLTTSNSITDPIGPLMEPHLRRTSSTSVLLDIIWETLCRQPRNTKIPNDYIRRDVLEYSWVTDQRSDLDKYLKRLKDLGYIKIIPDSAGDKYIRLTQLGVATLVRHCLVRKARVSGNDGHDVSILSFDIPENRRKDRLALRKLLKIAQYTKIHKSTWVGSPRITDHLLYLIQRQGLSSYVRVYLGREKRFHN